MLLGSTPAESSARVSMHHQVHITHTLNGTQLAFFNVPTFHAPHVASPGLTKAAPVVAPAAPVVAPAAPVVVAAAPVVAPTTDASSVYTADWMCIRVHESGNRYNDPAEPSGAYGILLSTWRSFGFSGWPYQASPIVQDALALRLYNEYGFHPWSSRFACGL
jgi:hypothetical protein